MPLCCVAHAYARARKKRSSFDAYMDAMPFSDRMINTALYLISFVLGYLLVHQYFLCVHWCDFMRCVPVCVHLGRYVYMYVCIDASMHAIILSVPVEFAIFL